MEEKKHKDVKMPLEGRFKFVLIQHKEGPKLRGGHQGYHADIVDAAWYEGLEGRVLGGGRIHVDPEEKEIHAYGFSRGYGTAPQDLVEKMNRELLKNIREFTLNIVVVLLKKNI